VESKWGLWFRRLKEPIGYGDIRGGDQLLLLLLLLLLLFLHLYHLLLQFNHLNCYHNEE
jgi:hypothetical protein